MYIYIINGGRKSGGMGVKQIKKVDPSSIIYTVWGFDKKTLSLIMLFYQVI